MKGKERNEVRKSRNEKVGIKKRRTKKKKEGRGYIGSNKRKEIKEEVINGREKVKEVKRGRRYRMEVVKGRRGKKYVGLEVKRTKR